MVAIWLSGFGLILGLLTLLWLLSLRLKDSSIIDIFWGLGFVVLAVFYNIFATHGYEPRQTLLTTLVAIWGLRLGGYIYWRNHGKGEDPRYQKWRKAAGDAWWWRSYFKVFVLQGVLMNIIAIPLLAAQYYDADSFNILDALGAVIWLIGFAFEAGGDWQLARFKANPANKGKVLDTGFWRYTRHPNYFGDACQWWGYYAIALAAGGWWSIFAPALMTLLLMRVSGVTLLEKSLVETKPQYREYIRKTSAFIPRPPRP
ncbi:MAG: DUF1295 domain-containing protein [Anaerolineales bacterium]|nr:DUF1295 domain-containing protein [Anaerolineales bacterium]